MNTEQAKQEALEKLAVRQADRVLPVLLGRKWEVWTDQYTWMFGVSIAPEAIIIAIGPFEIIRYLNLEA